MTRQEVYQLRDEGGIAMAELIEQFCGDLGPEKLKLEVGK
jgi:hypothetical protein